jgi:hypothetical protein
MKMSDQLIRKSMLFPESLWSEIEDFRFDNRIKSDVEAIRLLMKAGLHFIKLQQDDQFTQAEQEAVERLNAQG